VSVYRVTPVQPSACGDDYREKVFLLGAAAVALAGAVRDMAALRGRRAR